MGEFIIGVLVGLNVGVAITAFIYVRKINHLRFKIGENNG